MFAVSIRRTHILLKRGSFAVVTATVLVSLSCPFVWHGAESHVLMAASDHHHGRRLTGSPDLSGTSQPASRRGGAASAPRHRTRAAWSERSVPPLRCRYPRHTLQGTSTQPSQLSRCSDLGETRAGWRWRAGCHGCPTPERLTVGTFPQSFAETFTRTFDDDSASASPSKAGPAVVAGPALFVRRGTRSDTAGNAAPSSANPPQALC